ncbi:MAG TPA: hypothetical protein VKC34_02765, partial [Blastocatellia bacterium]|nr:hypothetical protein [Blastocatellia bacterium]
MSKKIGLAISLALLTLSVRIEIDAQTAPKAQPAAGARLADEKGRAARLALKPCRLPYIQDEARCGTYEVFEDRESKKGRKVSLNIAVLPALGSGPAPDPIFYLSGGPGSAAVEQAGSAVFLLEKARKEREIVLVDQRGTGASNPLRCDVPAK